MQPGEIFELLLEQGNDPVWVVDKKLKIPYANTAYKNLVYELSGTQLQINGSSIIPEMGEAYNRKWQSYYEKAMQGFPFEVEDHFYNPATRQIHFAEVKFAIHRKQGREVEAVVCVLKDVTEYVSQRLEARHLLDASLDVFCTISEAGIFTFVSGASKSCWGYHPEELIGKPYVDFILAEDVAKTNDIALAIMNGTPVTSFSNRYRKKNGEIAYNLWSARWDKATSRMYCVAREAKDKFEEELKLKLLEKVINEVSDAVILTEAEPLDEPGPRIQFVNKAFTRMTGYSQEEVIGKSPRILQGIDSDKTELAVLGEKLRRWEASEITVLNYTKTGEEFWVNFAVSPIADQNGWFTHWVSIQREVTEQKNRELERELLTKISLCFAQETDLGPAAFRTCQIIYEYGNFDLVELWCPTMDKRKLKLTAWHISDTTFYSMPDSNAIADVQTGLKGEVWQSKQQVYWEGDDVLKHFQRKKGAELLNLTAVLGVPLFTNENVVGIIVIGLSKYSKKLLKFKDTLQRLESFLGAEINRKQLENNVRHVFDAIPDILCVADNHGRILKINKSGIELLQYTEQEIPQLNLGTLVHPEDNADFKNRLNLVTKSLGVLHFDTRLISKLGKQLWFSCSCVASSDEGLLYISAKNVTGERDLRLLNKQAQELALIGSWEIDLVNGKVYWSEMLHRIHETSPEEYEPDPATTHLFFRADYREFVINSITHAINSVTDLDIEAVIVTTTLKEKWVRVIGKVETINGVPCRMYGSFQDITFHKETELRFQSLADNIPGVVFQYLLYPDGTDALKLVSKGAYKVWGYSPEEVMENVQLVWAQTKAGGDYEEVQKSIAESARNRQRWSARYRSILPTGEVLVHFGTGTPAYLTDGTIVYNSVVLDITSEAKSERILQEVTQMAKIGIWEADLVGGEHYKSAMVNQILELEPGELIPDMEDALHFCKPNYRKLAQAKFSACILNGQPFDFEVMVQTAKGNDKWLRLVGSATMQSGVCTKIIGSLQDITAPKLLELQIKEILDSISDAFYALDGQWNFTYFNKEAENLLLVKNEDVLGKNIWEVFPAAAGTELEICYNRVLETALPESIEYYFPGDNNWYEVNVYRSKDGLSVYFKNINERREVAAKLQSAFEEKNDILESIGDALITLRKDWIVTYWNQKAEEFLGKERHEVLGKNIWDVYQDVVGTNFYHQYHLALATGQIVRFEERYEAVNKWFQITAYPSKDGLSVYFTDATLRKETERKLIKANERFEKVTQATNDAIWDWDIKNNNLYRSNNIDQFFGQSVAKQLNQIDFWQDAFHPDDLERIQQSIADATNDPNCERWEQQYRLINANGDIVYVLDRGLIVRNEAGEAIRMVGAMSNLTERIQLEIELKEVNNSLRQYAMELERSNEELEQFAFITSHDLQEPLRMISSFMDQLKRKYGEQLDEKAHQYIHFATDGARKMKKIILELLEYSRASRPTGGREQVNINDILQEFAQLRRKIISEKGVVIQSQPLPIIHAYKAAVTQVFHCLLDNAIKYSKEGTHPVIDIAVEDDNSTAWKFSVKDNGIGIESQFYDKIFIIFQRLHNRNEYSGTGIGLSIAKRHIEIMGGKIWVESRPGEGSIFYFTIPRYFARFTGIASKNSE